MSKRRVFIGSSTDRFQIAWAIKENLEKDFEVTVWDEPGVFELSQYTLDSILSQLDESDFGVFVFDPADRVKQPGKTSKFTVRDNVLYESGLFAGRLGRERAFFVAPKMKGKQSVHVASDLNGITFGYYNGQQAASGNVEAALEPVCDKIRESIAKVSPRKSFVPTKVVDVSAGLLSELAAMISDSSQIQSDLPTACRHVYDFAQNVFNEIWPQDRVIASFKIVDIEENLDTDGNPTQFRCFYAAAAGVAHRDIFGYTSSAKLILAIDWSVAGKAFTSGEPVFVPDVQNSPEMFSPELFEKINGKLGCVVAWPLVLNGKVAAIFKVDSRTPHLLSEHNHVFLALIRLIEGQFLLAMQLWYKAAIEREAMPEKKKTGGRRKKTNGPRTRSKPSSKP